MNEKIIEADIVVVGAGLAGTAAAISIAQLGLNIIHLAPNAPKDHRTSALMGPSIDILVSYGLVPKPDKIGVELSKILMIDATDRLFRAPEALFDSREAGLQNFGYNFTNTDLLNSFEKKSKNLKNYKRIIAKFDSIISNDNDILIKTDDGALIKCKMLVGSDGKQSFVRKAAGIGVKIKKHAQSALVCDLILERDLNGASVEFHYENGPFTLVPAGGKKANLVWVDNDEILRKAQKTGEKNLVKEFEKHSQNLFGKIKLDSKHFIFPLSNLNATTAGKNSVVLVGEAAHAFPPVGAQGLNLSLRDIVDLLDILKNVDLNESDWAIKATQIYATRRAKDIKVTMGMVDMLFKSLLIDFIPVQAMRASGIWALKTMPFLRKKAFKIGMGRR